MRANSEATLAARKADGRCDLLTSPNRAGVQAVYPTATRTVTALAAHDPRTASESIAATLGPLAGDEPASDRLRETLRVYLEEADNPPRTAARLYTHRNTVLKRIARATDLRGYLPGERRLALALAIELRRHLQPPAS